MAGYSKNNIRVIRRSKRTAEKILDRLTWLLDQSEYPDAPVDEQSFTDMYLESSKIANDMRSLLSFFPSQPLYGFEELDTQSFAQLGYYFELTDRDWIRAVLPLPKSTSHKAWQKEEVQYKMRLLDMAVNFSHKFGLGQKLINPENKVAVVLKFVLDKDQKMCPDYDNTDSKMILNTLSGARLIYDDSPEFINLFFCSERGDRSALVLYVLPDNDFEVWLKTSKNAKETL